MSSAIDALRMAPSDFAVTPDDIWDEDSRPHVQGINEPAMRAIATQIELAERSARASVYGLPIIGEGGRGKSHLLGQARIMVQRRGGFFVRFNLLHLDQFWSNLAGSYLYALNMPHRRAETGLAHLLETLADRAEVPDKVRRQILGDRQPENESISRFIESVRGLDPTLAGTRKTLRALIMLHSRDEITANAGEDYLNGGEVDFDPEIGMTRSTPKPPREVVRDLSQLMSICGATVVAVDQVDDIVRASMSGAVEKHRESAGQLLDMLGINLIDVRDETRRTTVFLACLSNTWREFGRHTTATIVQRFEAPIHLDDSLPSGEVAAALLAEVLKPVYRDSGYEPPYPSYPFPVERLEQAVSFSPRHLLRAASLHLRTCVAAGVVTEIERLDIIDVPLLPPPVAAATEEFGEIDERFARYRAAETVESGAGVEAEYRVLRPYLGAGLNAYRVESGRDAEQFVVQQSVGPKQGYHVEVRDKSGARARRWVFRAIGTDQGAAVLHRVRQLYNWAKLGEDNPIEEDHGVLWVTARRDRWRNWTPGTQVWEWVERFGGAGMEILTSEEDFKTFGALHRMETERVPGYEPWLRSRRPASRTNLMQAVFGPPPETTAGPRGPVTPSQTGPVVQGKHDSAFSSASDPRFLDIPLPHAVAKATARGGNVNVGAVGDGAVSHVGSIGESAKGQVSMAEVMSHHPEPHAPAIGRREDERSVHADLAAMAKHTVVFAGSGSGKTVLLRRIIEAAALQGVSAIVLDPNNDLSRLGQAWPTPPEHWLDGDGAWADAYADAVEVVVWTPGRSRGRPLSFQPLPDFSAVASDPDEFEIAVDTAVNSLVPRARIGKATPKDDHSKAVLKQALAAYARDGSSDFEGFLLYLEDLPDEVSSIGKAADIAAKIASTLRAAVINDRVFAGAGSPLDPSVLLTPSSGRKARVSVVNFIGLPTEEQRQGFVNQLELALFSWAKRHPAVDRPLSGLLVLDEAQTLAPSSGPSLCLDSTLALASQARKYGLGMLFATQAPKGVHNRIVGNCATHWYGRINAPSQIAAANEVAQSRGGTSVDLARLSAGQFYLAADGRPTERVDVPMCLTYHPPTAPTVEEILAAVGSTGEEPGE
ncbi:protein of unknown function DUF87 [Glycomyces sambucus]|uniref:AAA+ ATPase domain-containing protein n=1 Tax=Glycomyces sambucus TaxID=380244 RepID=A0A1G9MIZ3_9ACTN|nr:DUF87 domain-containing protein [Glycomyces sambucus]SDL73625.1 protein of unknown function DUF87 [Glycomyces sambucus]